MPEPAGKILTAKEKKISAEIEETKGPVTYQCVGCGESYEKKPLKCTKCGGGVTEPVRLEAAAAQHAKHQNKTASAECL